MKSHDRIARLVVLAAALSLAPALPIWAQTPAMPGVATPQQTRPLRIAVINGDRVLAESNIGKTVQAEGQKRQQDWEARIRAKQTELDTAVRQGQEQRLTMTQEALTRLQEQVEQLRVELQRLQDDYQRDINRFGQEAQTRINAQLIPAVERLATEDGYDLILDTRVDGILYFADAIDATERFIAMVNAGGGGGDSPEAGGSR